MQCMDCVSDADIWIPAAKYKNIEINQIYYSIVIPNYIISHIKYACRYNTEACSVVCRRSPIRVRVVACHHIAD